MEKEIQGIQERITNLITQIGPSLIQEEARTNFPPEQLITIQRARRDLNTEINELRTLASSLLNHCYNLTTPPNAAVMAWAQTMIEDWEDTLVFLKLDTTGIEVGSDIIRITLVNSEGLFFFDQFLQTEQEISEATDHYNGADLVYNENWHSADEPAVVWRKFLMYLEGKYVLCYNLKWTREVIQDYCMRHNLRIPTIIGECFQERCRSYLGSQKFPKLEEMAARMGYGFRVTPPDAKERLRWQLHILKYMRGGVVDLRTPEPAPEQPVTTPANDDFDPFLDGDDLP